jgi:N-acyl-L-homoserine lactone synthetase
MNKSTIADAILGLRSDVIVELANTASLLREAMRLRYQVYCVERGFEAGQGGLERDEFDDCALHAVVRLRETGEVAGTVRLILPNRSAGEHLYPIQRLCGPAVLRGVPLATTGEVSRFALAKQVRGSGRSHSPFLRLALIRGAIWLSSEAGHTHWLAVMEPTLLRLLGATGLHFDPIGPLVDYHGIRQPAVAELVPVLRLLALEQPAVWEYVTCGGTLFPDSRPETTWARNAASARAIEAVAA